MGGLLSGLFGGGDSGGTISPAEVAQLTRQQQRMNNPNVSNQFGSTSTTFGADDQANITQNMSEDMQGLYSQMLSKVQGGASQYTPKSNSYNQQMMQNFNQNMGNRSGFQVPQRQQAPNGYGAAPPPGYVDPQQPMPDIMLPNQPPVPMPIGGGGDSDREGSRIPINKPKDVSPLQKALMNLRGT